MVNHTNKSLKAHYHLKDAEKASDKIWHPFIKVLKLGIQTTYLGKIKVCETSPQATPYLMVKGWKPFT